mgnify:FL=1
MNIEKFVGIPWVEGGRSFTEADCYGILMLYYKEFLEITLKDYIPDPERVWFKKEINESFPIFKDFNEVTDLKPHDVLWIKWKDASTGITNHVAVYLGKGLILESAKVTGSIIVPLKKRRKLVHKCFRHRSF